MSGDDLTSQLYRRRKSLPRPAPFPESGRTARALDAFGVFVAVLVGLAALLQSVLMAWFDLR